MKAGSLVIFLGARAPIRTDVPILWVPRARTEVITVREMRDFQGNINVVFEEGIIGYGRSGIEIGLNINDLVEVQSPEEGIQVFQDLNNIKLPSKFML